MLSFYSDKNLLHICFYMLLHEISEIKMETLQLQIMLETQSLV